MTDKLPFRQIHMDFHTSPHIPDVGGEFSADEYANTLAKAHVNSVTCFARCHHGLLYYDSKRFPERVHPTLKKRDMLREQIAACHKLGIRAPVYVTVQWDDFTANEHPEWLCLSENGDYVGKPFPKGTRTYEAGFYRALCVNSPYRDFLKEHVRDIITELAPVDGFFFDIIFVNDCSCKHCRKGMQEQGIDPSIQQNRLDYALKTLDEFVLEMTSFIHGIDSGCSVFYNKSHVGTVHRRVLDAYTHFELESLPGGGAWGYWHFPVAVRYARTLGKDCVGMTGKFHTEWGDFRSYKNLPALEYECFRMLAMGAGCMVGDQLEPHGRITPESYSLIGEVYRQVEEKEPWCENAMPIVDIGVFTPEEFSPAGDTTMPPSILGAAKMLSEGGHQFDIIDSKSDFSLYKVLILPDNIPVDKAFCTKLTAYLEKGGAVLASFESGMNADKSAFSLKAIPASMSEKTTCDGQGIPVRGRNFPTFDYADYILPHGEMAKGMRAGEHVMYIKGVEVDASADAQILADVVLPYFDRTWEHYCSHRQTPPSEKKDGAAIVKRGNTIYFAHPVFLQYNLNAPLWCKKLVLNALELLLPQPVIRHNGPSTLLATANSQPEHNRMVAHLLHYIPERRCDALDIIEDVIDLYDVELSLRVPAYPKHIRLVPQQTELPFTGEGGIVSLTVPKIYGHQMVCIEF